MTTQKKPEILFVWSYHEWGGVQIYFLGIMRRAMAQCYAVKAVMPRGSSEKLLGYLHRENIPTEFFDSRVDLSKAQNVWHKIRRRFRDAHCSWTLGRHLGKQNLRGKIIQIDAGVWSNFWLLLYLCLKTNVFLTMHIATPFNKKSVRDRVTKLKYHLLCRLPTFHLLASNQDMKNSLRPFLPADFWEKIPIAYTGVNTTEMRTALAETLDRERILAQYNLPNDKLFVVSLGNIIERKGFRVFLEAAQQLLQTREDLFFIWIGDGEQREEMLALTSKFGLENAVKIIRPSEFGGARPELLRLLRLADIYAHPSFAEGLPGAMLEAMALGKPTVASKVNAIPECVVDGQNGFLIEAGNAADFAVAVAKLADDRNLRETFGIAAQEQVLSNFAEERCAEITISYYEKTSVMKTQGYLMSKRILSKEAK